LAYSEFGGVDDEIALAGQIWKIAILLPSAVSNYEKENPTFDSSCLPIRLLDGIVIKPTSRSELSLIKPRTLMPNHHRGVDTRNAILSHSLDLFSTNGYDATSVADICDQAQVSKGAFYHHFPSKQDLFLALMTTWLDNVDGMFQTAGETAADIPDALEKMAGISGGIYDTLEGGFPILLEFWTQASRQPAIWEQAVSPYRRYLDFFESIIKSGREEGAFDEALDDRHAARILMAVAMGLLLQASFDPDGADWQEVTQFGTRMLLRGMRSIK